VDAPLQQAKGSNDPLLTYDVCSSLAGFPVVATHAVIVGSSDGHALRLSSAEPMFFEQSQILVGIYRVIVDERDTPLISQSYEFHSAFAVAFAHDNWGYEKGVFFKLTQQRKHTCVEQVDYGA
jgi:hypothetical protein